MVHNRDCREVSWGDFDVMITDPPYRPHVHKATTSCAAHGARKGVRQNDLGFAAMTDELRLWTCGMAAKAKRWSLIYTDIESVGVWAEGLEKAGAHYIRAIPWIRWSMPQLSGDRPPQGCEMVVLAWGSARGRKSWNGPGNLTHLDHLCLRGAGKHPAEKPLDQNLDLVQWFSNDDEQVSDPFSGSGTTGLACAMLKRGFVGSELSAEWAAKANARIAAYPHLSPRDQDRFDRWSERWLSRKEDQERREAVTAKVRARYAKKPLGERIDTPSASERTLPMFDDPEAM